MATDYLRLEYAATFALAPSARSLEDDALRRISTSGAKIVAHSDLTQTNDTILHHRDMPATGIL